MADLTKTLMRYVIALYIRLSSADRDTGTDGKDESDSITAQRDMLHSFIAARSEFAGAEIIEFCDDGRTGTNFERTGVAKMLNAAKRGQINCIIVKDLSRFGRDYIEVGDYLEQIFPFLGIRFIAINDNYDSIDHPYGSAGLIDVSFKNVIYDLYSKELSEKIRTTKKQLAEKGYFLSPYAFYGYDKVPGNNHELMIDESTAVYVREVFSRFQNGEGTTELARDFNLRRIPTPMMVKRQKNVTRKWNSKSQESNIWSGSVIRKILIDERYTGVMIYGKNKRIKVGSGESVPVPKEEWTVVPDVFPALVTKETFAAVQEILRREYAVAHNKKSNVLFHRKIQCGYCGLAMTRKESKNTYYVCQTYKDNPEAVCPDDRIYESEITEVVLAAIRKQAQLFRKTADENERRQDKAAKRKHTLHERISDLRSVIGMKSQEKMQAFEDMVSGRSTPKAYQAKCERCDAYIRTTEAKISALEEQQKKEEIMRNPAADAFLPHTNLRTLTRDVSDALIDKIYVYSSQAIEIVWKFKDEYKETARKNA